MKRPIALRTTARAMLSVSDDRGCTAPAEHEGDAETMQSVE